MIARSAGALLALLTLVMGAQLRPAPVRADMAPSFVSLSNGIVAPWGHVVEGADHQLYGTTHDGGAFGTVFRMTPEGTPNLLYRFPNRTDGTGTDAPAMQGSDGRLYGTTNYDGGPARCGTAWAMNTDGSGFTVLHTFADSDGCRPWGGLLEGDDGQLYGTTTEGGPTHRGVIFRMGLDGSGFTALHIFSTDVEGTNPHGDLIQGPDGRIYGTTFGGGPRGGGEIYASKPDGTGFTTIFGFGRTNADGGANPRAGIILGSDGALYGTTSAGGQSGLGSVFRVGIDGKSFTVLHAFASTGDGRNPTAELLQASDGRLYGTTPGDASRIQGTVFSLRPDGSDFTTLHSFAGGASDGWAPQTGLIQLSDGRLVGTTTGGGAKNSGTVYTLNLGLPRPAPTIHAFTPTSGPWGTSVLIHGSYFVGATAVGFHGVTASPTIPSGQWVRTFVPTLATTGPLTVTNAGGTATGTTFTVLPTVTHLSATSGKYGDTVVITGTNLTGVKSVTFNGTAAHYTADSPTQITATVPEDSTSGPVVVTTADGTASGGAFTVTSLAPSISISQLVLTHVVKGKAVATSSLKSREQGTFTLTYTTQNPGSHVAAATVAFLKNGKVMGSPLAMQGSTDVAGQTVFTAARAFSTQKKTLRWQAQITVTLGSSHDTRTIGFKVVPKKGHK